MSKASEVYDPTEQDEIAFEFAALLKSATKDGAVKRARGEKVSWKVDKTHKEHMYSHLHKYEAGLMVDPDSGAHPLVHLAWRALGIAYQAIHADDYEDADDQYTDLSQLYF